LIQVDDARPFSFQLTNDPRDAVDHLGFLVRLTEQGVLVRGDIIVMDNASIHYAADIAELIEALFDEQGIFLLFLPCYSPELNPIELAFSSIKTTIRALDSDTPLWVRILLAFATIERPEVERLFLHCLNRCE